VPAESTPPCPDRDEHGPRPEAHPFGSSTDQQRRGDHREHQLVRGEGIKRYLLAGLPHDSLPEPTHSGLLETTDQSAETVIAEHQ
jgi:hypothetical protein